MKPLQEFYAEHPALYELTKKDATVYAWFKQCELGRCTIEEALTGAVVYLAQEKNKYFDELVQYGMIYGSLDKADTIKTVKCPACTVVARGYEALEAHMKISHPDGYLS